VGEWVIVDDVLHPHQCLDTDEHSMAALEKMLPSGIHVDTLTQLNKSLHRLDRSTSTFAFRTQHSQVVLQGGEGV